MKKMKLIKKFTIICALIIAIELLIMLIMKIVRERRIDHIDSLNDIIMVDDYYIGVGISDFSDSSFVSPKNYTYISETDNEKQNIIATQAKIVKYDKNQNIIWENTIEGDYDSTFYSVLKVDDGFLAVGSYVSKYDQLAANTRDAIIVKYDFNGKLLWSKNYHVLSDTEFYKIIDDGENNYVVIGQSIYENMELGNHIIGGGIIVRYDSEGNVLAHNNYGGNKSGSFNDIIKVDDGYYVCGKDGANYGIVIKFAKDFDRDENDNNLITKKVIWQRTYSNTDSVGFTSMLLRDNIIYAVGAINVSKEKNDKDEPIYKYDAGIVLYNTSSKYLGSYSLGDSQHHCFNSVIADNNNLLLTGILDVDNRNLEKQKIMTVDFDLSKKEFINKKTLNEDNDYLTVKALKIDNKEYLIGSSKTKCNLLGCEYEPMFTLYK